MKAILIILSIAFYSCVTCPPGSDPKTIQKWERKRKFTAKAKPDSCTKVWMLWVAKKS